MHDRPHLARSCSRNKAGPCHTSPFDAIRQIDVNGQEYWSARDLQKLLGYKEWRKFEKAIERAMISCEIGGLDPNDQFVPSAKLIIHGKRAQRDVGVSGRCYSVEIEMRLQTDKKKDPLRLSGAGFFYLNSFHAHAFLHATYSQNHTLNSQDEARIF